MKIEWFKPARGGRPGNGDVALAVSPTHKDGQLYGALVTIYPDLMKAQGWKVGDRVMVGAAGKFLAVQRVESGGWYLSAQGKSGDVREAAIGTQTTACIKMTLPLTNARIEFGAESLKTLSDGTLLFPRPLLRLSRQEGPSTRNEPEIVRGPVLFQE